MNRLPDDRPSKRLLLVEPPFYRLYGERYALVTYPLSLAHLAMAVKERTDWEVKVYNADFAPTSEPFDVTYLTGEGYRRYTENLEDPDAPVWQPIRAIFAAYRPSVVGISVKSSGMASAGRVARIAKDLDGSTLVVAGGPHPSATGSQMLDNPDIDLCVAGEGEETLVELLRTIEAGSPLQDVKGLHSRSDQGHHESTPRRGCMTDLDTLGFPFRHAKDVLIDFDRYPQSAFGHLFATRGCPHRCLFCGSREVWGPKPRFRSPEHVAAEIAFLQDMGVPSFHFDDDTFGVNHTYLQSLCGTLMRRCPGITWSCEIHVGLVTEENVALMKQAGCAVIQLGVESGNDAILRQIRKGFTIEEALAAGRLIGRHGIGLHTFFMAGFPWETRETLLDTARVIEAVECEKVIYSLFTPYPGTEAFRYCETRGLIPADHDPSLFGHQSPRNCFCLNMKQDAFRGLSGEIEEMVVRKNRAAWQRRLPDPS